MSKPCVRPTPTASSICLSSHFCFLSFMVVPQRCKSRPNWYKRLPQPMMVWALIGHISPKTAHVYGRRVIRLISLACNCARVLSRALLTCVCRSEEHTSELQSRGHLVCRLLLEKKNIY